MNPASNSSSSQNEPFQPIAIIGMGCRFPGGCDDIASYWNLLSAGRSGISRTPADRWNLGKFYRAGASRRGKTQSQHGGFVKDIDAFDPELFGISPREAACMDPQQRMLLETAFRAIEDGGVPLESIAGRSVSVHVGISSFDYAVAGLSFNDRGVIGPYSNTGGSSSIAANRISYSFDLRGESVAVDTACSSSLIATHLACRSLQDAGNELALAGGANALLLPDFYVAFSQLGVLSPDGACKTFDAAANGYVRSEGAGMILLKRLDDAIRDRDRIYAVIRGSATNQDGRTDGMTVPSREAQQALINAAVENAGIRAKDVSYVEAHGTGTPVGDPIEASAICESYGGRAERECCIASVKTNLGHLEAGAGIASVIKVALALDHRRIPAHLHLHRLNPQIDFASAGLRVPTETESWDCDETRFAAINGFGYGGANAHLILSEYDRSVHARDSQSDVTSSPSVSSQTGSDESFPSPVFLPLSAHSRETLQESATVWASWLEACESPMREVSSASMLRRSHLAWRSLIYGHSKQDWIRQLTDLANRVEGDHAGEAGVVPAVRRVDASQRLGRHTQVELAFVCGGQGPQWWAMGREMLRQSDVYRSVIERCDREFAKYVSWSLLDELQRDESASRLQQTSIAQPAIFALQISLAAVWKAHGVAPTVIVGHSVGEIAAAYLSGALAFADACCVAVHRGRTMDAASSKGAMLAVGLPRDEVQSWLEPFGGNVSIAAMNGPASLTLSGCAEDIQKLAGQLETEGVFCRKLQVEYAFHSSQMDPVRDELLRVLSGIVPQATTTDLISTVTGKPIEGSLLDAEYWWKNVRQSVLFADAINELIEREVPLAIELSPHPVLSFAIAECYQAGKKKVSTFASLRRDRDDLSQFSESLGQLYGWGFPIDWNVIAGNETGHVELPKLVMNRKRLWSESRASKMSRLASGWNGILGDPIDEAESAWLNRVDLQVQGRLGDHRVRSSCVLPAAAMLATGLAAGQAIAEERASIGMAEDVRQRLLNRVSLRKFRLANPRMLDPESAVQLRTRFDEDRRLITLSSREAGTDGWQKLSSVECSGEQPASSSRLTKDVEQHYTESVRKETLYAHCDQLGLHYGPGFRGVVEARRAADRSWLRFDLPDVADDDEFGNLAAALDSCFHGMIVADPDFLDPGGGLYLPQSIESVDWFRELHFSSGQASVRIIRKDQFRMIADLDLFDDQGEPVAIIRGFESVRVSGTGEQNTTDSLLYQLTWKPSESIKGSAASPDQSRKWLIFADQCGVASQVETSLPTTDRRIHVQHGTGFKRLDENSFIIDPENEGHFRRLLGDVGDGVSDIAYYWGLDSPDNEELSASVLEKSSQLTTLAPLHLVKAWQSHHDLGNQTATARLTFVTVGAQPLPSLQTPIGLASAPLIGFGRVVISECASLRTKLVDLAASEIAKPMCLGRELVDIDDAEDEILYHDSIRFVRRFESVSDQPMPQSLLPCERSVLHRGPSASIQQMRFVSAPECSLADDEVEIEVIATGLNFSDVMKALNLYPGLPDGPPVLGAECSGRVLRVGRNVKQFHIGQDVFGVAPGSFSTHVVVKECLLAEKPACLTHEEAAAIPIAFLTAEHALNRCARIRPDDRVLIHAASGGVGIAAMQMARSIGCTVYGTAGTDRKRAFVAEQGASLAMNSRDLGFAKQIMEETNGEGIDVVLNSLPGEAIAKGMSILRTGGRFLEIGKRDIYSDAPLGLEPFKNNLAFFAIDLDQLIREQPELIGSMLRSLVPKFESVEYKSLPTKCFDSSEVRDGYRYMQQAQHIGKVVVDFRSKPDEVFAGTSLSFRAKPDRSYWVAGGLGGFGLRVARWLVDRGAKRVVVGGRSQTLKDSVARELETMRRDDVRIDVIPVDLSNANSVRSATLRIEQTGPRLAGVFHTAMVLEDALLTDLDRATLESVLRPKVQGGWNLHEATAALDIDQFVLFSSLSSIFGHAGQANYSAANAWLDSLGHYRQSIGMTATVINWGHVGNVGYLAERTELSERLKRQGVLTFSDDEAMQCLDRVIGLGAVQLSVLRMDWSVWRGLGITGEVSPRFAGLLQGKRQIEGATSAVTAADVRNSDASNRGPLVATLISEKIASLLGIEVDKLSWDQPLLSLGLDSLMAVEMRNWVENQLKTDLPIAVLMQGNGLHEICELITGSLDSEEAFEPEYETSIEIEAAQAGQLLEQLPEMSDDDVDALLNELISKNQGNEARG
ncbi:MAG: SDR family NAD(P)-dependent oxidoreductase [Planctomycetota bacterium]